MDDKTNKSLELKEKGNVAFKDGKWAEAIIYFSQAIELDPTNHIFYSNRSGAQINLKQYNAALEDAKKVIELKSDWGKGYVRKGTAEYLMDRLDDAEKTFNNGLLVEPNSNELISWLKKVKVAKKIDSVIPKGCWPQVPITYDSDKNIVWENVDSCCNTLINRGANGLWAVSPASEVSVLSSEDNIAFLKRVIKNCIDRKFPVIASVKFTTEIEQLAQEIKKTYECGVNAVVIDLTSLGHSSDSDSQLLDNFKRLIDITGDIPLGIYESKKPYYRNLTPNIIKGFLESEKVYFAIYTTGSVSAIKARSSVIDNLNSSFRFFIANGSAVKDGIKNGASGITGESASFLPKICSWLYHNYKHDQTITTNLGSFLSLSEPTFQSFFPLSLKVFWKLHEDLDVEPVSKIDLGHDANEETLLRLTHLHEAAEFVELAISETQTKKKDSSVLL